MQLQNIFRLKLVCIALFAGCAATPSREEETKSKARKFDSLAIYDLTARTVDENFYDKTFRGLDWPDLVADFKERVGPNSTSAELKSTLNSLLGLLKASHTEFLTTSDQTYFALKSIFSHDIDGYPIYQIGAWFKKIDDHWFIRSIFKGLSSENDCLKPGDEIISVDGKSLNPVSSFNSPGLKKIEYRRSKFSRTSVCEVNPHYASFQRALLEATQLSAKVFSYRGKRVGYFHLWAGTHDDFRLALRDFLVSSESTSDAMILDLRDGFGGAHPGFIEPFFSEDEDSKPVRQVYTKPLVVLINEGTRSGKEWISLLLKRKKRGILIGEKTAGYFLSGKLFDIEEGHYLLYLAVDGNGPQGVDLEGKGVFPEISKPFDFKYSQGKDPQLERALQECIIRLKNVL